MGMVWHDDKCTRFDGREMHWNLIPPFFDNLPVPVQPHFPIDDLAEQVFPLPRHRRDEIRARLRIIVSLQPGGLPALSSAEGAVVERGSNLGITH